MGLTFLDRAQEANDSVDAGAHCFVAQALTLAERVAPDRHFEAAVGPNALVFTVDDAMKALDRKHTVIPDGEFCEAGRARPKRVGNRPTSAPVGAMAARTVGDKE